MVICSEIKIGSITFDAVAEVEIKKTWKTFTDTAIVKIPSALHYRNNNGEITRLENPNKYIKVGDKVVIKIGYNRKYITEFTGYVSIDVKPNIPLVVECECEMWQLKRKRVSISMPNATVRQILNKVAPEYQIDCINELYGRISMKDVSPLQVFNELKKRHHLYTFFRNDRLVCGKVYSDSKVSEITPNFAFGKNIIESDLNSHVSGKPKVLVKATSTQSNGVVFRVTVGELSGNVIEFNAAGNISKEMLTQIANRIFSEHKNISDNNGFIKSFGFPFVEHGQTIRVYDDMYYKRGAKYFVDEVLIQLSPDIGYKRTIELGKLIESKEIANI